MKKMFRVLVVALLLVGVGSAAWLANTIAQEAAPASTTARVGDDEAGRLPPGYTVVVTKAQRAKIYAIQDSYQQQLADLKQQIEQVEGKRNAEIEALLDEEQMRILGYVLKLRERERSQESSSTSGGS